MSPLITHLYRYPIKGLSAQSLTQVLLTPGKAFPGDRRFALRHAKSAFDLGKPVWHRKSEFVMLAHTADVAKLQTDLSIDTGILRITVAGATVFAGNVFTEPGRRGAQSAIDAVIKDARGGLQLIDAGTVSLTDVEPPYISIINLATVRDLALKVGQDLDADRFRGNIVIDHAAPWAEFDWVDRSLKIGDATLKVIRRIGRCSATSVNTTTAIRDIDIPAKLSKSFGHMQFGVYAEVTVGGTINPKDSITLL